MFNLHAAMFEFLFKLYSNALEKFYYSFFLSAYLFQLTFYK